jgi:hypothetical protein
MLEDYPYSKADDVESRSGLRAPIRGSVGHVIPVKLLLDENLSPQIAMARFEPPTLSPIARASPSRIKPTLVSALPVRPPTERLFSLQLCQLNGPPTRKLLPPSPGLYCALDARVIARSAITGGGSSLY